MEDDTRGREQPQGPRSLLLSQLRWHLAGLRMSGIKDWPVCRSQHPLEDFHRRQGALPKSDSSPWATEQEGPDQTSEVQRPDGPLACVGRQTDTPDVIPPTNHEQALHAVRQKMGDCRACRLYTGRNHLVFGDGSPQARLVFVGEGPGFDEDRQGLPFVGRAGKLLDKMIRSMGFRREEVYICNVVKCRPPNNRTPSPDEIESCSPFLVEQLQALQPQVICALGACAAQTLLGMDSAISRLRGRTHKWRGIPLVCTYHPAYLLRNPIHKALTWQDLLMVTQLLRN